MGIQCHSKPIPSKSSFSKLKPPLPQKVKKFQGKPWELNLPYVELRSQLNPNLLCFLKSWLLHLGDDLELYQNYSPSLKWNHFFIPFLAFPEHLLNTNLCVKFAGSEIPKITCLSLGNSANQQG